MSTQISIKPSELKSVLKLKERIRYRLKGFLGRKILLEDTVGKRDVDGRIVTPQNEEEVFHWPRVIHKNLLPLLDIVPLDDRNFIFVFPVLERSLRTVVRDPSFMQHPKCFHRKISYAKDVLCGLEYLHGCSLSLMNLDDGNVFISNDSENAVISDFSCVMSTRAISAARFPTGIPGILPPEVSGAEEDSELECSPVDIWRCGVMFLQMFTGHVLPWCGLGTTPLEGLDIELLRQTNAGSRLQDDAADSLREFLARFLQENPNARITAADAMASPFLNVIGKRLDEQARDFWKAHESEKRISVGHLGETGIIFQRQSPKVAVGDVVLESKDLDSVPSSDCSDEKSSTCTNCEKKRSLSGLIIEEHIGMEGTETTSFRDTVSGRLNEGSSFMCDRIEKGNELELAHLRDFCLRSTGKMEHSSILNRAMELKNKPVVEIQRDSESKKRGRTDSTAAALYLERVKVENSNRDSSPSKCVNSNGFKLTDSGFDKACGCVTCKSALLEEDAEEIVIFPLLSDIPPELSSDTSWEMSADISSGGEEEEIPTAHHLGIHDDIQGGFLYNSWMTERKGSNSQPMTAYAFSCTKQSMPAKWVEFSRTSCGNMDRNSLFRTSTIPNLEPMNVAFPAALENVSADTSVPSPETLPESDVNPNWNRDNTVFRNSLRFGWRAPYSPDQSDRSYSGSGVSSLCPIPEEKVLDLQVGGIQDPPEDQAGSTESGGKCCPRHRNNSLSPSIPVESSSDENRTVDIPMELPLCSEISESGKLKKRSRKSAFRGKSKHRWARVLCLGSKIRKKRKSHKEH